MNSEDSHPTEAKAPIGFRLLLPDDWIEIDLDPETGAGSRARLLELWSRHDARIGSDRDGVEQLLQTVADNAVRSGAQLCALRFGTDRKGQPVQAIVSVGVRSVDGSTDPAAVLEAIEEAEGREVDATAIRTGSGSALKVAGYGEHGVLHLRALIGVPEVPHRLAVISLSSPSLTHDDELRGFFEAMVRTFAFTWEGEEE